MSAQAEVIVVPDAVALQEAAAERVLRLAQQSVAAHGIFTLGLAGGNTPLGLYRRLTQAPYSAALPWAATHIFWGDERYVPPADPDSLQGAARAALLDHVPIPPEQIYPVPTYYEDPAEAAVQYERQLQMLLEHGNGVFDLLLLGMGPDGHTASLFPHHPALRATTDRLAVAVAAAPKPPPLRISLTVTALNHAAQVLFLVTGADKSATLRAVLQGPEQPATLPVQLVRPPHGRVTWLVDEAAAAELS